MIPIPFDYETLRVIWWALLGVLLTGFAIMGGMDLGVGTLLPFVAKSDDERRVLINLSGLRDRLAIFDTLDATVST